MRTIAIMNNKGGVGKTVTAINLADILVRDYRQQVLLVDSDGQCNLSEFCLPSYDPDEELNLYHILTGQGEDLWSDNVERLSDGLTLLPASPDLYELDLRAMVQRAGDHYGARLRDFLDAARMDGEADFAILDCAPGLHLRHRGGPDGGGRRGDPRWHGRLLVFRPAGRWYTSSRA